MSSCQRAGHSMIIDRVAPLTFLRIALHEHDWVAVFLRHGGGAREASGAQARNRSGSDGLHSGDAPPWIRESQTRDALRSKHRVSRKRSGLRAGGFSKAAAAHDAGTDARRTNSQEGARSGPSVRRRRTARNLWTAW